MLRNRPNIAILFAGRVESSRRDLVPSREPRNCLQSIAIRSSHPPGTSSASWPREPRTNGDAFSPVLRGDSECAPGMPLHGRATISPHARTCCNPGRPPAGSPDVATTPLLRPQLPSPAIRPGERLDQSGRQHDGRVERGRYRPRPPPDPCGFPASGPSGAWVRCAAVVPGEAIVRPVSV